MRRLAIFGGSGLLAIVCLIGAMASPAHAVKEFKDQFEAKYIKADSSDTKDTALRTAFEKAKCSVCHAGSSKKQRNAYGQALEKLLDRKTDRENKEKIQSALEKVSGMKCRPDDPSAPTFGRLIEQGKLPADGGQ